jgi:RNA polymerase sigma factor (sigma-70 family)
MSSNEVVSDAAAGRVISDEDTPSRDRVNGLNGLVRLHHLELVTHVNRRIHSLSDAKDIVQQLWFNLFRSNALSGVTNLRAYLYKAAGNSARDWNDKKRVRQAYADEQAVAPPDVEPSAEEICEHRQELEYLLRQIDRLPRQYRMAILLVRCEGLSLEEAAVRLGVKPGSVKKSLQRAMKQLATAVPLGSLTPRGKPE